MEECVTYRSGAEGAVVFCGFRVVMGRELSILHCLFGEGGGEADCAK